MEGESARGWGCDLPKGTIGNASRTCHGKACGRAAAVVVVGRVAAPDDFQDP